MTRKDYEIQAGAISLALGTIKTSGLYDAVTALELMATILADSLEKDNPRFDRSRFLKASGVESN